MYLKFYIISIHHKPKQDVKDKIQKSKRTYETLSSTEQIKATLILWCKHESTCCGGGPAYQWELIYLR